MIWMSLDMNDDRVQKVMHWSKIPSTLHSEIVDKLKSQKKKEIIYQGNEVSIEAISDDEFGRFMFVRGKKRLVGVKIDSLTYLQVERGGY